MQTEIGMILLMVFVTSAILYFWRQKQIQDAFLWQKTKENQHLVQVIEQKEYEINQKENQIQQITQKKELLETAYQASQNKTIKLEQKWDTHEQFRRQESQNLENARKQLENEQKRIRNEHENNKKEQAEQKHKSWTQHEAKTLNHLKAICTKPEVSFPFFDNTNTPKELNGLKPDFCIQLLDEFIIFDAKTTTANRDLWTYLVANCTTTAKKYAKTQKIHRNIYFIVPNTELASLRETHRHVDGFDFHIISPEACQPILKMYKKLDYYHSITDWDPKERENFINLIARYDMYLYYRNATDLLMVEKGNEVMQTQNNLKPELQHSIQNRKKSMSFPKLKKTEYLAQNQRQQQSLERNNTNKITY